MTAGERLIAAVMDAMEPVAGIGGVHDGAPVQAAFPYAVVEAGPETDWSHKSGVGRELRVAVIIRDAGERPTRLRRLMGEAEAVLTGLGFDDEGWRLVAMQYLRSRVVREQGKGAGPAWAGVVEFRARMLAL